MWRIMFYLIANICHTTEGNFIEKNWWSEVSGREGIFTQTNMDDLQGGETIQHSTATLDTWNICQNLKKREH